MKRKQRKWIHSTPNNENFSVFHYGEIDADGLIDDEGSIVKHPGKRPSWVVSGGHSGTADSVGQAKRIVQKLVRSLT